MWFKVHHLLSINCKGHAENCRHWCFLSFLGPLQAIKHQKMVKNWLQKCIFHLGEIFLHILDVNNLFLVEEVLSFNLMGHV